MTARANAAAIVLEVHLRSSVAGLRALGRAGIPVVAVGSRRSAAGRWSRYVGERASAPDYAGDPAGSARAIAMIADARGPSVAYPGSEVGIDAVIAAAKRSPAVIAPFPIETLDRLRNKPLLAQLADAVGVRTPPTVAAAAIWQLCDDTPRLPCAIKPVAQHGRIRSTTIVRSPAQIIDLCRRLGRDSQVLVQPLVPGALSSLGIVIGRDGAVTAAFQQVARRTWPAAAGSSARGVSVPLDGNVVEQAASVLRAAGFYGLAEVEFLLDGDDVVLIDVNPRFYGCLALALASGVNLPAAWRAAVLDLPAPPQPRSYRAGVTYRWLEADVVSALRGHARPLFERAPRPRVGAMWAPDDPVPSALMAGSVVTERLRARLASAARVR